MDEKTATRVGIGRLREPLDCPEGVACGVLGAHFRVFEDRAVAGGGISGEAILYFSKSHQPLIVLIPEGEGGCAEALAKGQMLCRLSELSRFAVTPW
jgi:hypothetical protein